MLNQTDCKLILERISGGVGLQWKGLSRTRQDGTAAEARLKMRELPTVILALKEGHSGYFHFTSPAFGFTSLGKDYQGIESRALAKELADTAAVAVLRKLIDLSPSHWRKAAQLISTANYYGTNASLYRRGCFPKLEGNLERLPLKRRLLIGANGEAMYPDDNFIRGMVTGITTAREFASFTRKTAAESKRGCEDGVVTFKPYHDESLLTLEVDAALIPPELLSKDETVRLGGMVFDLSWRVTIRPSDCGGTAYCVGREHETGKELLLALVMGLV